MDETVSFDGKTIFPVTVAESVAHTGELVRRAAQDGHALFPLGGRTMIGLGQHPNRPGIGIDLRKLDRVIDYPARDMTITVQGGISINQLQTILRAEKQYLPVDVPFPDRATLGGTIAANANSSRRFGCGTLRDYLIGISIVNDAGQEVKAGGRVVKNVAGYDFMKLYTGSMGTLGIISQVTLKVKPLPEACEWHVLPVALKDAADVAALLSQSRTRPIAIDLMNLQALRATWWPATCTEAQFIIGFEDNAQAVAWELARLRDELPDALRSAFHALSPDEANSMLPVMRDFPLRADAAISFKANLLPSRVTHFLQAAESLAVKPALQIHVGNGIIHGDWGPGLSTPQVKEMLEKLGRVCTEGHGNLIVTRCPPQDKATLPIWGRPTGDRKMMQIVKDSLDPNNLFNPGRFVDGI